MNRREFLTRFGKGAVELSLAGSTSSGCRLSGSTRRNVILVTMDTTRKDHLGCYGYGRPTSANLDRFAEESVVFDNCYSTTNNTLSSHSSILTGLHPHNHGVLDQICDSLDPRITTLANRLSNHEYRTVAITSAGFMNKNNIGNGFQGFWSPKGLQRSAEETTRIAIDLLDALGTNEQRFFLWLHYWDPHHPYDPPEHYDKMFFRGQVDENRLKFIKEYSLYQRISDNETRPLEEIAAGMELTESDYDTMISMYDGEIAYMDYYIGEFMNALKERRLYDDSIIVFTADHGESFFENDSDWLMHCFVYEPVVRVPLIMRNPDMQSGRRVESLTQSIDIAPTLLNWLDLELPQMDGKDVGTLTGVNNTVRENILLTEAAHLSE